MASNAKSIVVHLKERHDAIAIPRNEPVTSNVMPRNSYPLCDFHLAAQVRPRYIVQIETRLYIHELPE